MTQKNLFSFKRPKLENSLLSFGQQFWGLFLLSACGSGGGVSVQIPNGTTGTVIDGYISGARVFGDINNNKKLDSGESFVLTNSSGRFSGLQKSVASTIIADNNSGQAIDITTGLNFAFTMAAPQEYQVITPITTLVAGLVEGGDELSVAEKKLKFVLSLDEDFQLSDYDPFLYLGKSNTNSQQLSDAENYQLAAVKIANLLIARDGNYFNTTDEGFSDFLGHLSQIIDQKYKSGTKLNLGEKSDLGLLLTDRSAAELENLADLNTAEDYYSILDKQLLKLTSKTITISDSDDSDKFVTVQINANFERTGNYSLTLENNITKATITSTQLTAVGNNVAVFKFSANDIESVGFGSLSATVENTITGEVLDTNFSVQVNRDVSFDDSSSSEEVETQSFDSGVVADGYISNARVFRDENENDQFDAGEIYVLTNSDGEFTNLGGNAAKPIVADGNGGKAVDTSTGITFNSVLSAPAGSKVVNPITTIVNELIQDDTSSASSADKIASANEKVATALGLTAVKNGSALVDFTKFDPISNKVFSDDDTPAVSLDANLATVTQGVATFVANLIVSGVNEKGGDVSSQAASTRSLISNIKDVVKTKSAAVKGGDATAVFDFTKEADILSALGDGFNSSSNTLEKLKKDFSSFDTSNPAATAAAFSKDKLIEKQLAAQSEFGDKVLTSSEAANGALLVVGPTYDPSSPATKLNADGTATVKITNESTKKILFKTIKFEDSKYASIDLSSTELNSNLGGGVLLVEVKKGTLTASTWDASTEKIFDNAQNKVYFHKDISPQITFDTTKVLVGLTAQGNSIVKSSDTSFQMLGTVKIDIGLANLPTGITLGHLVDGLGTEKDGTGRDISLEFFDSSDTLKFSIKAEVAPVTNATNADKQTGDATFKWKTADGFGLSTKSLHDSTTKFSDLADGNYNIKTSFSDAYGAKASESTFSKLTIDRNAPEISAITAKKISVGRVDEKAEFTIGLSEAPASIDTSKILIDDSGTSTTLAAAIAASKASYSIDSSNKKVIINYTPSGTGTLDIKVKPDSFEDAVGNKNTNLVSGSVVDPISTSNATKNQISYDMVAPSLQSITMVNASGNLSSLNTLSDDGSLKVKYVFSEKVESFSLADTFVSSINGIKAGQLSSLSTVSDTTSNDYQKIWTANFSPTVNLEGNITLGVGDKTYTDSVGNLGPSNEITLSQDTRPAQPFQVALNSTNEKASYGVGDTIHIEVTYDAALLDNAATLKSDAANVPRINLTIGENIRPAKLDGISGSVASFKYVVTNADLSDSNGVQVSTNIDGAKLTGADQNITIVDIGSVDSPINLSGKSVDGGTSGSAVDGYVEGAVVYADNDRGGGGTGLTEGDSIAKADSTGGFTIYGASGPLVLEGGYDISTNKDFNVRYQAPGESGVVYEVINPITTLVTATNTGDVAAAETAVFNVIYNGVASPVIAASDFRTYNAYAAIAEAADSASDTNGVKSVVDNALIYQKAAASFALVADFLASASYFAQGKPSTTSIAGISDTVFSSMSANLTAFANTFVNQSINSFYDGLTPDLTNNQTVVANIVTQLKSTFGGLTGVSKLDTDFGTDVIFNLIANGIAAINGASTTFDYASNSTQNSKILEAAEDGINALTEIVQVQKIIQNDMLSDLMDYYDAVYAKAADPTKPTPTLPTNISASGLLGSSPADGYLGTAVGTVVPIRYELKQPSGANALKFEGSLDGTASEFEFTIVRSGSIKTTSTLNYRIEGNINASDIAGGELTGQLAFDVNEKEKKLKIGLNNDTVREADETLSLLIFDPTNTSQIVSDRAAVIVKDDDPSIPKITQERETYKTTEDGRVYLDDATIDYFDTNAFFKLEWVSDGGTLTTKNGNTAYTSGSSYVSFYDLQTSLLRNLEFVADGQTTNSTSANAILTLTAAEKSDGTGRSAIESFEYTFGVSRLPSVDISSITFDSDTSYAGMATKISGIKVSDPDTKYTTVTISSNLEGTLGTTSSAGFSQIQNNASSISFSGEVKNVQDALDNLVFTAKQAGSLKLTFAVDDNDPSHARNNDGTLKETATAGSVTVEDAARTIKASAPTAEQYFIPNVKVGSGFWNPFTGIRVADIDSDALSLTISSTGNKFNFRLYDTSNTQNPLIKASTNSLTLTGSPADISTELKFLQVETDVNEKDLISVTIDDGDSNTANATFKPTYIPMDNAVPDPGGNVTASQSINEDGGAQNISIAGIRLYDADAFENGSLISPTALRIISSEGGTVSTSAGLSVYNSDGSSKDLSLTNAQLSLRFNPEKDFNGTAKISYVVVDPQQSAFASAVSEILVPVASVNDNPVITLSSSPTIYLQGADPITVFQDTVITDVDNELFSQIQIVSNVDTNKGDLALFAPETIFGMTKSVSGATITYSGSSAISASNVASLLSNIKFASTAKNLINQERQISVSITDELGAVSSTQSKKITLEDVNDGPNFNLSSSEVSYTEGGAGITLGDLLEIKDPEDNNIHSFTVNFSSGYKSGQDTLALTNDRSDVRSTFDEGSGSLLIEAVDALNGFSTSVVAEILDQIKYQNSDRNPNISNVKKITFSAVDTLGASATSNSINIKPNAVNDAPEVYSLASGSKATSATGEQFIKDAGAVKAAPSILISDPDDLNFSIAHVEIVASNLSSTARLGITQSGLQMQTAFNLKVDGLNTGKLTIYKGTQTDNNFIGRDVLEKILKEITYENSGSALGGNSEIIVFKIADDQALSSAEFRASVNLLDKPPVEVSKITLSENTEISAALGSTSGTVNLLKFNAETNEDGSQTRLFNATQVMVDMTTESIRTDVGRFKYDPSITKDKIKISDADHLDIRYLSGQDSITKTNILGKSNANLIFGSDYDDYVDGNGGKDIIKGGKGNDTIALRLSTSGAEFDGGEGGVSSQDSDTLLLPSTITGEINLSNFGRFLSDNGIKISNFENLDARSATNGLTLKGDTVDNILSGGAGNDTIWIGAGKDTVSGGGGNNTFVVDISQVASNGARILDLKPTDKIKFHDGANYLASSSLNWLFKSGDIAAALTNNTLDAWISHDTSLGYMLNIEHQTGLTKSINIGTEIYGSIGKWVLDDGSGNFTLQPELNTKPIFKTFGQVTTKNQPLLLKTDTTNGGFSAKLNSQYLIEIEDSDNDALSLELKISGGKFKFDGQVYDSSHTITATHGNLNAKLKDLEISGTSRGDGKLTLEFSDGYSDALIKEVYFEIPNSAPSVTTQFSSGSIPSETIKTYDSLKLNNLGFTVSDPDVLDASGTTLVGTIDVQGGKAQYLGEYQNYVQISGGKVTVAHDGSTAIPEGTSWINLLSGIIEEIGYTKDTVGRVDVNVTIIDELGASAEKKISFDFTPKPVPKPALITTATSPTDLNGSQFDTGTLRVFVKDIGASVGDKIIIKTGISGTSQTPVSRLITSDPSNSGDVIPFIDVALKDLVSGASKDGAYEISVELHIGGVKASETTSADVTNFNVDTIGPATPTLDELFSGTNKLSGTKYVTKDDITSIIVSDVNSETNLSYSLVRLHQPSDGNWYDFSSSFSLNSLLLGNGLFKNEISAVAQSYNETTKKFTLTLNSPDDGIYAIIARDNVGNVSAIDLSTFDIASTALPAATFIIDKDLDASDIGYDLINASSIPGPDYKYFKLGSKDAAALEIEVAPDVLGGSLPSDVVKVTLQIWGDSQDLLVDGSTPEFQGVISKNLSAVSDHWSVASGSGLSISSKSSLNNPIIELNLKNALPGTSGTIGLKFTAEDIAGNTVSISTPTDQIELDLAADLETSGVPNQGLVTSIVDDAIYSGISVAEAKGLQMSISGLDDDTDRRATFFLSKDQFVQSLKLSSNNNPFTGSLETLTMDASHTTIGGIEVPQYNSGTVYLDLQSAFIQSLKLSTDSTVSAATSTKPIDWKFIGISSGKAQYIAAQDYNDYILEGDTVNLSNYKIYLSDFVVNSHSEGEYITKLEEVTQDISVILKSAGSPNETIFIINQVYDLAGNTEFRDGILNASDPATTLTQKLVVDVKPATVQEGLQIGGLGDTGVANNDLVTNLLRPSITFSVDEEIISARLVRISDLKTYPMPSELVQYDLRISETLADDGFTYDATLGPNVTLAHGIWGVEVTDVAGNKNLADASPLLSNGVYETNTNLVSATNGLLIIDTDAPPDATINVVGVETEGGFLNNDESISSVEIQIMPGHDDMSPEVSSSKQVAKIIEVLLNEDKINSQGGAYFFDATNAALSEGLHTISVKTMDLAGNFTTNLYTFIKDVTPPPAPLQTFTLENAADGILNREEIGYGTGGKNLKIDIALKDPTLTRLVSVKIDGTLADKVGEEYFVNVIDRSLSDGAHKVTVEVADLAGNITAEELDFNIDTVLPDSPNILVNNAQVKDGKFLLDYWGTLQNVATNQGVIFRFDEISNGDKVISSTVKVNDSSVFVVEEQNSVYFVDRTYLKDSGIDGAVSNTISAQVQEISGNIREFTKTFFSDLDETTNQYFEIAPTLYTTGAGTENVNTYIRLDVFVSDQALADTVDTTLIGTSFDLKLDLPSEIFGSKASDVVIVTNSKIEGFGHFYESLNSIRWSGYSEINLTNFDEPLLSIISRLPNIDAVKDKTGNVTLSISKIDENVVTTSMDLFDLNYSINMSELVITDSSNIM